jgi:hypothetical protein
MTSRMRQASEYGEKTRSPIAGADKFNILLEASQNVQGPGNKKVTNLVSPFRKMHTDSMLL